MRIGRESTPVYLIQGANVGLTLNTKEFDESLVYTGDIAAENNYLAAKYLLSEKEIAFDKEDAFVEKYKAMYGKLPSKYAIRGYDLTMDVLLRQAVTTTFEGATEAIGETTYLENKFNYYKSATGGYVNKAMYILRYTPELTIEEASLETKLAVEE